MIRIVVVRILVLVVCCFFAAVIESESVLAKEYMDDGYYLISDFEIIEDVMGTDSFDEISGESYASRYKPYPEKTLSLGITISDSGDSLYDLPISLMLDMNLVRL